MTHTAQRLSVARHDYLRAIYLIERDHRLPVTTTRLAATLSVSVPSATAMLKKLGAHGYVEHVPYHGARLTPHGEAVALELVRHHRLIELYLADTLGLDPDALHTEADRLEHALSDELARVIDTALGHPTHDPHGQPIPRSSVADGASP